MCAARGADGPVLIFPSLVTERRPRASHHYARRAHLRGTLAVGDTPADNVRRSIGSVRRSAIANQVGSVREVERKPEGAQTSTTRQLGNHQILAMRYASSRGRPTAYARRGVRR